MERPPDSHKGENGKVAVIGGSETMHGAPLFSALAAERSGVDLLFVSLPHCHTDVAKQQSLNLQVHPFCGNELEAGDFDALLQLLATVDVAVIGPGLARTEMTLKATRALIESAPCPLVLDASALQPWTILAARGKDAILTPHLGELERMGIAESAIGHLAEENGLTIHVKGPIDHIASPDGTIQDVEGGNAGLTVGGTGDALAGLIAGLRAQRLSASDACSIASTIIKRAGDVLGASQGYAYTTREVIEQIPFQLRFF